MCSIPPHSRPAHPAQYVLCTIPVPILVGSRRCMPDLPSQPDTIDGTGSQCHGDGIPLGSFSIATVAHHPRPPASLNMAFPEGRPSGCDFSHERDAAACCHAEWPPHPYVKSRILPRQDPGTLRGRPSPSLRAVGAYGHSLSEVSRRLIPLLAFHSNARIQGLRD